MTALFSVQARSSHRRKGGVSWRLLLWCGVLSPACLVPPAHAVAPKSPHVELRGLHEDIRAARRAGMDRPETLSAKPGSPRVAARNLPKQILVLLVDFSDEPRAPNQTTAAVHEDFFGSANSLLSFYETSSYGRYIPQGSVAAWLRLPRSQAFYADGRSGVGGAYPRNARRMVEDAIHAADSFVDYAQFDNDGPDGVPSSGDDDGYVDALIVVHAGEPAEANGNRNRILSHNWFTPDVVQTEDGTLAWAYSTVSIESPLGTRVHEFGHLLGLPDLYDTRAALITASGGLGFWSLMAVGNWLGDGHTPADFDAASKIQLGFVDPIVVSENTNNLSLSVSRDGKPADVYQVWTHGEIGDQYFVIENRRRQMLDQALPGSGMLVYRVDLLRSTNNDPERLHVTLLQADGRRDIENFQNSGDSGDPLPGSSGVQRLDAGTNPDTRDRNDADTQVVISNVSIPTAVMTFDLQVESGPDLRLLSHETRELQGDLDGFLEVGESIEFRIVLRNAGLNSETMTLTWSSAEAGVSWGTDSRSIPSLDKGATFEAVYDFVLTAITEHQPLSLVGEARAPSGDEFVFRRTLPVGDQVDFVSCLGGLSSSLSAPCENNVEGWSSQSLQGVGEWLLEQPAGELQRAYRSRWADTLLTNELDLVLTTPPFQLLPGSRLELLHDVRTADLAAGFALAGGRVEIALDGGAWQVLQPQEGYPRRAFAESMPQFQQSGIFGGHQERQWSRFELGERAGSAQVRFRYVQDRGPVTQSWQLYAVEVNSGTTPAPGTSLRLVAEPNPVRFPTWIAFRIVASRSHPPRPTRLQLFDVRGRLLRTLTHESIPAQSGLFTWDGTDRAGRSVPCGLYFARLEWGGNQASTKILVVQ